MVTTSLMSRLAGSGIRRAHAPRRASGMATNVAQRCGGADAGLALVAVLWMVAALTLSVSGVLYAVRGEIRNAAWQKELSVTSALADAGVIITARELAAGRYRDGVLRRFDLSFEGHDLWITAAPLNGLVDLNAAPELLLTDLIAVAGGVDRSLATRLAQRIIDWRDADDSELPLGAEDRTYIEARSSFRTRGGNFEAPEDLLQVLGVDFELYLRISKLVTADVRGSGLVNPGAAPLGVLAVLAGGNIDSARDYSRARARDGALADSTRFPAYHLARDVGTRFLIEVRIGLSNGSDLVARKSVDVASSVNGIPWTILRSEHTVEERAEQEL